MDTSSTWSRLVGVAGVLGATGIGALFVVWVWPAPWASTAREYNLPNWDFRLFFVTWAILIALWLLAAPELRTTEVGAFVIGACLLAGVVGAGWLATSLARADAAFHADLPKYSSTAAACSGTSRRALSGSSGYFRVGEQEHVLVRVTWLAPTDPDDEGRPFIGVWLTPANRTIAEDPDLTISGYSIFDPVGASDPGLEVKVGHPSRTYTFQTAHAGEPQSGGTVEIPISLPSGDYHLHVVGNCKWTAYAAPTTGPVYGVWVDDTYTEL